MSTSVSRKLRAYSSSSAVRQARTMPPITITFVQSMSRRTPPVRRWKRSRKVARSATAGGFVFRGDHTKTTPSRSGFWSTSWKEAMSSQTRNSSMQPGTAGLHFRLRRSAYQHSIQLMERSSVVASTEPGTSAARRRRAPYSCSGTQSARRRPSGSEMAAKASCAPPPRRSRRTLCSQSCCRSRGPTASGVAAAWWPRLVASSRAVRPQRSRASLSQRARKGPTSSAESRSAA
mmetsp:Transcript_45333/g.135516  ORF Transcript_45333/g.135516 Transcript_45333/m.135516 type:complete len:233 (-) Transcript_45333:807-1505(-)